MHLIAAIDGLTIGLMAVFLMVLVIGRNANLGEGGGTYRGSRHHWGDFGECCGDGVVRDRFLGGVRSVLEGVLKGIDGSIQPSTIPPSPP